MRVRWLRDKCGAFGNFIKIPKAPHLSLNHLTLTISGSLRIYQ
nr:MAG TPA: hypothetical protein [Caudoviricetes sp.]